ncbi:MAG: hypothetical protein ACLVJZ_12450, partial [[Clostridium] leptum]
TVTEDLLWKNTPKEEIGNFDYLVDVIDWEKNVDPEFHKHRFMAPKPVRPIEEMEKEGFIEEWICYKCPTVCAKRLTILPGATVTIRDSAAYGFITIQGHGKCGVWNIESPAMIRFGQLTNDEFFVSAEAAQAGVTFTNPSDCDPIVILKHFSENPDLMISD